MHQSVVQPVNGHRGMGGHRRRFVFGVGFLSKRPGRTLPELDPPSSHKTLTHRLERRYVRSEIRAWEEEWLRDLEADGRELVVMLDDHFDIDYNPRLSYLSAEKEQELW